MKQVLKSSKNKIDIFEVATPSVGEREILIKVFASVISSGTETMGMKSEKNHTPFDKIAEISEIVSKVKQRIKKKGLLSTVDAVKRNLSEDENSVVYRAIGYSNAGVVIAIGRNVSEFNVGDHVACAGSGIATHSHYASIPVNLAVPLPKSLSFEDAAFTTIGSIALQGIRRSEVTFGEHIAIIGTGLIGLLALQIAKSYGLCVTCLDINESRLAIAKTLGADNIISVNDPNVREVSYNLTEQKGFDAVLIYASTSSSSPSNMAMQISKRKGRVVVVGAVGMNLEREEMYKKEIDFVISTSYGPGRYDDNYEVKGIDYPFSYVRWTENRNMREFVRLLSDNLINISALSPKKYRIEEAETAYRELVESPEKNLASLFVYSDHPEINRQIILKSTPTQKNIISVGIIGAGGFIQGNHLPNLKKLSKYYDIHSICDRSPSELKSLSEKYKVKKVTTDYLDIVTDTEIDLVIVGTRHNTHFEIIMSAIANNKHILVEKPLCMTQSELEKIRESAKRSAGTIAVGFNRRYSIYGLWLKDILKNQIPVFINYRINAGHLPEDHWTQQFDIGGGRIIGEFCHFIDFVNYLINEFPVDLSVSKIPVSSIIKSRDNVFVNLSYPNGSAATVTYTTIGNKSAGKERIEVFFGNNTIIVEDFKKISCFGSKIFKGNSSIVLDKGHANELEELGKLLSGKDSKILPFDFDLVTTELTFKINEAVNE